MTKLTDYSLTEVRDLLASGEVKAAEATEACLARIEETDPKVSALLTVTAEQAVEAAKALDKAGPDPSKPLWGVPMTVKDVFTTKGVPTTCASKILDGFTPPFDATPVARIKEAGAVILGKCNMDEFAMGSTTENSAYLTTKNPWDLSKVPGGSSGGSAASVSARQAYASLGTDTGGSIRLPASFCGVFGIKPTYGRVSRYGLVAFGSSLDQAGPITRTVRDAAAVLSVIAGVDPRDSTSADLPVPDYESGLEAARDLKGLRIGLPEEYWGEGVTPEVKKACRAALDKAVERGATLVPVSLPHTKYAVATYYIIAMAEASSNLARFDGVRYGFRDKDASELLEMYRSSRTKGLGDEVQRRIIIGTYVLSSGYYDAYYRKAAQVRRILRDDFLKALTSCDVICGPACPDTAYPVGGMTGDPLKMYLTDIFTISLNLAGLPGASLPVGLGESSAMPVGLQIFGPSFGEERILGLANALEQAVGLLPEPGGLA